MKNRNELDGKEMIPEKLFFRCLYAACILFHFSGSISTSYAEVIGNASSPPIVSKITVDISVPANSKTKWNEIAENLIFLKEGNPFSTVLLEESIAALKISECFQEIDVDSREDNGNIMLFFRLKPFRLVKDIKINGQYPLFERDVLTAMTLYPGDAFVREELSRQVELISETYKRRGFIAPKIEISGHEDPEDGYFIISIKIDKGPYHKLNQLEITGNRAFSAAKLKSKMKTWRSTLLPASTGRFLERDLKTDVEHLTAYYRKKGYADVMIAYRIQENPQTHRVSAVVHIDEGPRYKIAFSGNEHFWDYTLKKDLALFKEGNNMGRGARKSAGKIKDRYRMAGYPETRVKIEEKTRDEKSEKIRIIRFLIDEGPRPIVDSINISGNNR